MWLVNDIIVAMMLERMIAQAPDDLKTMVNLYSDPPATTLFADSVSRPTPSEWVANQIAGMTRNLNHALQDLGRECIRTPFLALEFPMPYRWDICPDVFEIDPERVHCIAVTA